MVVDIMAGITAGIMAVAVMVAGLIIIVVITTVVTQDTMILIMFLMFIQGIHIIGDTAVHGCITHMGIGIMVTDTVIKIIDFNIYNIVKY